MKTSNKLLLGLLIVVIIVITVSVFLIKKAVVGEVTGYEPQTSVRVACGEAAQEVMSYKLRVTSGGSQ